MDLSADLRSLLTSSGACLVGYADLADLPEDARAGLPRGVSLAVPLDPAIIARLLEGPFPEYVDLYRERNALLNTLAEQAAAFLQTQGYAALPQRATDGPQDRATLTTPLPHKTVATLAGLGWIGKCALLITREFGSALRLNSVLTDAPLPVAEPVTESRCGACVLCTAICPGTAVSGELWQAGQPREALLDAFTCFREHKRQMESAGMDYALCGRCITVCPWTQSYLQQAAKLT